MARHYSTKDFFRQMPNTLLARYFDRQWLFGDLDFSEMKETQPDELFQEWLTLTESQRHAMDAEFHEIFELSCEKGCRAIIDEAEWHLGAETDARNKFFRKLAALPNHFERAMTFLDYNQYWKGRPFLSCGHTALLAPRKNLPQVATAVDDASLRELARLIRSYFHHTEGRGNNLCGRAVPPWGIGLLFRLSGGLFAAEHRVGRRSVWPAAP